MSKPFYIHDDFLLETREARRLYHDYAADLPIIDYHCHLPPDQIAADRRWENLTQVWLYGDHYKWRALRSNGVPEAYCTGKASDWDKFERWAATMPSLVRNQLYNWTHLELVRYFGVKRLLGPDTAKTIWTSCNRKLARPEFSCRGLLKQSKVALVCTTDDPTDTLEHHRAIAADRSFKTQVLPTWRPDKGMAADNPKVFNPWLDTLAQRADMEICTFDGFLAALKKRHDAFHAVGCRVSDHGLETIYAADYTDREIRSIFLKARAGRAITGEEALKFKSAMLVEFAAMDHARGWVQQFHLGVMRNINSRMFGILGPDTGFDTIGDFEVGRPMARLLDRLESRGQLTKTIVYNVNPRDNAMLVTILSAFQDGSAPGKMQHGSAWWFLDQKDGMERQIEDLSQTGLLSRFVGMLTDSRSFLSFTRHEYFRRILCNVLGNDIRRGVIPNDLALLGPLVRDVSYNNAARYFGFNVPTV